MLFENKLDFWNKVEYIILEIYIGAWRSLVAHWHGVSGVGGSNPLAPTIFL